jgi:hypothetical protein
LTILLVVLCTGCATGSPPRFDISQAEKAGIHKIAILQVPAMPTITVMNSNVGVKMLGGGLIAGAIEQNSIQSKSASYLEELTKHNITFGPELGPELQAALTKDGYEVEYLPSQLPVWRDGQLDVSAIKTNADVVLVVRWGLCGYLSPDFDSSYTPLVNFAVTLVRKQSQKLIYLRQFNGSAMVKQQEQAAVVRDGSHGTAIPNSTVLIVGPALGYRYPSFEDLMARFDASVEGIRATRQLVVDQVAAQLAK